jgi:ABC-type sugar transport system ATPase subunit
VGKVFPDGTRAVAALDLAIEDGEFMVLVGPSGCGKTTTLRMTAGLEEITEGEIRIDERVVNKLDPRQRDVAMVFQNYSLYPHMSVFDNLAFPLRARRIGKRDIRERVTRTAKLLGLEEFLERKPRALSGGQRQRVAMGRAIVREPQAFLMDEPLSNLDAKLRTQMRAEIAGLQRELGVTTMYVTHDQVEAMTMGTHVAVMNHGQLQQIGTPQEVYARPETVFVARFIGTPPMNVMPAGLFEPNEHLVGVRPEHLYRSTNGGLRMTVRMVEQLGHETLVICDAAGTRVVVRQDAEAVVPSVGAEITVDASDAHRHRFDADTERRIDG